MGSNDGDDAPTSRRAAAHAGEQERRNSLGDHTEAEWGTSRDTPAQRAAHRAMMGDPVRPAVVLVSVRCCATVLRCSGIECIVFVGVLLVSMYSVFWSLIPQDAGPEGSS